MLNLFTKLRSRQTSYGQPTNVATRQCQQICTQKYSLLYPIFVPSNPELNFSGRIQQSTEVVAIVLSELWC